MFPPHLVKAFFHATLFFQDLKSPSGLLPTPCSRLKDLPSPCEGRLLEPVVVRDGFSRDEVLQGFGVQLEEPSLGIHEGHPAAAAHKVLHREGRR